MSKLLDLALEHAGRGWRVFPVMPANPDGTCPCKDKACTSAGKHPQITKWQDRATTDEAQIREWWTKWPNHNIGIATGRTSNLLILDADGGDGLLAIEERGLREPTPSVRTGRVDGGTHFYFTCPEDFDARNFAGKVPGLDARANGGYVVAAGSRHKTGSTYTWVNSPEDYDLAKPPKWLIDLLKDRSAPLRDGKVVEGGRNTTLFNAARGFRRQGMSLEQTLLEARQVNTQFMPPLPDHEVRQIVDSACREEYGSAPQFDINLREPDLGEVSVAMPELRTLPMTELGMAEAFALVTSGRFLYVHEWRKWMRWTGSVWAEDGTAAAQRTMGFVARARGMAANYLVDRDERDALRSWAIKQENTRPIEAAVKAATSLRPLIEQAENFDSRPDLIGMAEHTYDLSRCEARTPQSIDRITLCVKPDYNLDVAAPLWKRTLREVFQADQGLIDYFQRAIGYSITGSNKEQCMFICHGHGANGKSTILAAIRNVLGSYAATARYETFDLAKASSRGEDLAMLRGKRFVLIVEPDANMRLSEGRIKQVTGGEDLITCRHLYGKDFSYQPEFKLWMALNHKPEVRGTDKGIWRRIHLIPFAASFDGAGRNMDLPEMLKVEYSGILNWVLEGAKLWQEIGLQPPQAVVDATEAYKEESDIFGSWIDECLIPDEAVETLQADLYLSYVTWARSNGHRMPMTSNAFGRSLTERGLKKRLNRNRKTVYVGVQVAETAWG